ncbi:methylated-DNA--[protein]-cysteine S-methyltransferase [Pseudofulvibacter geojedonensis]|uniref:Methylated-DNA--protein-cysteine methyltransferase n=1 Tax=Pseudofulvibacter geojedonensis TaxID=1123758 RepID=A0ABW3I0D1_9FLAO
MKNKDIAYIKTPIGVAKIIGTNKGIEIVSILNDDVELSKKIPNSLQNCTQQLQEYFNNDRKEFDLKLNPQGTEFQKKVWNSLLEIPFGTTTSYLKQTRLLGDEKAIRAVASANGKNPIWLIIPCHRVIGANGSLTGYAGGLWRKKWLLEHELGIKQTKLF